MEKSEVYDIFINQSEIKFNKGYKIFEEVYEELKDILHLKREEEKIVGYTLVTITKGDE